MSLPSFVKVVEVGPRDGLQNEKTPIASEHKIEFVHRLAQTGLSVIETTSFVNPKWIPQLADAAEVYSQIQKQPNVQYPVLVPNLKGFERAVECGVQEIAVFTAASNSFCQKNINCTIDESIERFLPVIEAAHSKNIAVRGYVSCVLGCPYEGKVDSSEVVRVSQKLMDAGCYEVSLGDTIGVGTPYQAKSVVSEVLEVIPTEKVAIHFHHTYGQALANILACLELGIATVDASVAGLGGCPYAKGASGNVPTEDVIYMLQGLGISTNVDLDQLVATGQWISDTLQRPNQSHVGIAKTS